MNTKEQILERITSKEFTHEGGSLRYPYFKTKFNPEALAEVLADMQRMINTNRERIMKLESPTLNT